MKTKSTNFLYGNVVVGEKVAVYVGELEFANIGGEISDSAII
jgi:hypothetical protein